jgi:hypothetical protein
MNSFLTAMAFAIAVGSSPVMAQSRDPDADPGNIAPAERSTLSHRVTPQSVAFENLHENRSNHDR